ncbi:MAG: glycosyltransferase family 4 protein [Planctomycetota bacterium]
MRVLFLTQYPKQAPSPRYRVYQLVPWLEANGVSCDVQPLVAEGDYFKSRKKGNTLWKVGLLMRGYFNRMKLAKQAAKYDLVYVLKGAFMYGPPRIERRIKKSGTPMVFDFDDAIFIHKDSTHNGLADRFKSTDRIPATIKMVNRVVVPNNYLADYSRQLNEHVTVVAEAEDTDRFTQRSAHQPCGKITVGWIGSPSTAKYLKLITPALQEICKRHPHVILRTVGGHYEAEGVRVENIPWTFEKEVENFHNLDIGIMPLPLEEWSKGKSGCKLRQYMASGVPGVGTRIGYNCELVEDGKTGFLVETQDEWVAALDKLIVDHELRNQIANAARASVVKRFSIPVIGPRLKRAMEETIQQYQTKHPRESTL